MLAQTHMTEFRNFNTQKKGILIIVPLFLIKRSCFKFISPLLRDATRRNSLIFNLF